MMTKKEQFNFNQAFSELEKISQELEAEDVDLEVGLKKLERGLELAKKCQARLAQVENKVLEVKKKFGGSE